jgi:N-acetylglucosamine kinase-like BadF-type ATPase
MTLYLGVDGGQSDTTALIGDESGRVLGRGVGGPCNHAGLSEGRARLERAVRDSVGAACAEAGLQLKSTHFRVACFGMSGGPDDKTEILRRVLPADEWVVTTDAETALSGATVDGQGIIVIAGTGSIGFGRNANGYSRAGGWGYVFGDEGGAFDIVRQALRAALRMEEGWGPPTALRQTLLDAAGGTSANHVLHLFYGAEWPRSRAATLAPLVDEAATHGDPVALEILHRAAQDLAGLAVSVRDRLWSPGEPVAVAYIGGVFQSHLVLERFRILVEMDDRSTCRPPLYGPAEGALLHAYRAVGLNPALSR